MGASKAKEVIIGPLIKSLMGELVLLLRIV